jgi:hypothetical protein
MLAILTTVPVQLFPPLAIILAAVLGRTDRKLLSRLRAADATSPERALTFEALSGLAAMRLQRLTDGGAVVATPDGRYFLDEEGWLNYRSERRRRALGAVAIVMFGAALVFLFSR